VTVTYGELACNCGRPTAARAIGQVMARNPLPIIIPCHRVVGSNGRLTGFGGGPCLRAELLRLEAEALAERSAPAA
jgi:methylated-DNA-[protein]-cysteine S-methyltransferase